MNLPIGASLLSLAVALAACANSNPIEGGDAGGGSGVWSTKNGEASTSAGKSPASQTSGDQSDPEGAGGSGGDAPFCGDGVCAPAETCASCPDDCGACSGTCGDGVCDPNETAQNCAADCATAPNVVCGDNVCDPTETCQSCFQDCGICACMADAFEPDNSSSSAADAQSGTDYCGLSICTADVDWIAFTVAHGLTATLTFAQAEGDLDLEIYSAKTLDYVDGSYSHTDNESVTLSSLSAGTYWARVYGYQGGTNPSYCFHVDTN